MTRKVRRDLVYSMILAQYYDCEMKIVRWYLGSRLLYIRSISVY